MASPGAAEARRFVPMSKSLSARLAPPHWVKAGEGAPFTNIVSGTWDSENAGLQTLFLKHCEDMSLVLYIRKIHPTTPSYTPGILIVFTFR